MCCYSTVEPSRHRSRRDGGKEWRRRPLEKATIRGQVHDPILTLSHLLEIYHLDDRQRTIRQPTRYTGIALHTGGRAHLTISPAAADTGIVIRRIDLPGAPAVKAHVDHVVDVVRATTIRCGDAQVHTVEHVLAALYALGIDNAVLDMDGPEPPIADGSSAPYCKLIAAAGVEVQGSMRQVFRVTEPLYVEQGDSKLILIPSDCYRISCTVKYGATLMDTQYLNLEVTADSFVNQLCEARTFCLYEEIEYLMKRGLIRGGSLDNAVVMKDGAIISKDGLRYSDEFVRHKMLDIVGDLSLIGGRFIGHVIAVKPGHPLNVAMAQHICRSLRPELALV